MSDSPPSTAPKAKPVDLPDTGLQDDASSDKGEQLDLKTCDEDTTSTAPATPSDDGAPEYITTIFEANARDISEINLAIFQERTLHRLLVDAVVPISELRDEYKNPKFIEQINWKNMDFTRSEESRVGDGDCFYRAFGFAFIERIFQATDIYQAVFRAVEITRTMKAMFYAMSFDEVVFEDHFFLYEFIIKNIVSERDEYTITEESFWNIFQNVYDSNAIVSYLRMATAAQIQLEPDDYAPILTNQDIPDSEEILEPRDFNERFVIPPGREAGDVQISALCRVHQMNVDIAYVDDREDNTDTSDTVHKVRLVQLRYDVDEHAAPISLLYRSGQYDILVGKYHE